MTPLPALIGMGLAAHYITYVITESSFPPAQSLRDRVVARWKEGSWLAYLVTCAWCVPAYASAAVVGGAAVTSSVPLPVVAWLAVASLSGSMMLIVNGLLNYSMLKVMKDLNSPVETESKPQGKTRRRGSS